MQLAGLPVLRQIGQKFDRFFLLPCFQVSLEEHVGLPAVFLIPIFFIIRDCHIFDDLVTCLISPPSLVPNGRRP